MIHANRIVTVGEQECIIDRPIVLYRGDREVEIEFTLVGNEFMFSEEGNVIKSVNASHGQLVLNTPSGEHMFSELAECHEGKVVFVVTKEMIDEFIEMGFYSFQIRLYDSAEMKSRVTIPPVMNGFDIRNPIAAEDETNVVDQGIVDYARIFKDQSNEELPTFTWDGEYVKTEWAHHDVITENKMNKIEDALYSINANIKESDVVMLNALDNVKKDADKYVKEHMAEVEQDVEEFERNLNTDVQQFKIDTNAAMTAHKNEVNAQLAHIKTKKIYQFDSVSSMKEYDLNVGEVCETLGYYYENDGGCSKYYILEDNSIECDEAEFIKLNNGLVAKLIIANNKINFKQIGAINSEDFDCKEYMYKYIDICNRNDVTYQLYIPNGKWYFSETHINRRNGVNIVGDTLFPTDIFNSVTILPFSLGQDYIWKIGGLKSVDDDTSIKKDEMMLSPHLNGLTFSTNTKGVTHTQKSMLYIDCVEYGVFDNLFFFIYQGTGLSIRSSWELYFGKVNFRGQKNNVSTWGKPNLLFANRKMIDGVSVPNISAVEFNSLMFEAISGDCIFAEHQAHVTNCNINYINAEIYFDLARATNATATAFIGNENIEDFIHFGVVRGTYRYLTIGTINIDDNRNQYVNFNDNKYYFGGILVDDIPTLYSGEYERYYQVNVSNINFKIINAISKFACIFGRNSDQNSYINIGVLSYADFFPNTPINAMYMNKIRIASLCATSSRSNKQTKELIDAWEITRSSSITTDETSHNPLKLTYKKSPSNDTEFGLYTTFPYDKVEGSDKYGVVIVAKGEIDETYTLKLIYSRDGIERTKTITKTGTGEYEYIIEGVNASFGSYFEVREKSNNVNISKFGFITL